MQAGEGRQGHRAHSGGPPIATATRETQRCNRCGKVKPLTAFRRHAKRTCGYSGICKACRKAEYESSKGSFGPLPEPEGSEEWVAEIRKRARTIREQEQQLG